MSDVAEKPTEDALPNVPDPFDPESLKRSQNFSESLGVTRTLNTVPVKKPSKEWFIQVHPADEYRLTTGVIDLKEDREIYLISPELWSELAMETTFSPRMFVTAINRQGVLFLWPVRLPGADGKIDEWSKSSHLASQQAVGRWVRVSANMDLGAYEVAQASPDIPAPEWPEYTLHELLKIAFRDKLIDSLDHTVLRKLRGEI